MSPARLKKNRTEQALLSGGRAARKTVCWAARDEYSKLGRKSAAGRYRVRVFRSKLRFFFFSIIIIRFFVRDSVLIFSTFPHVRFSLDNDGAFILL